MAFPGQPQHHHHHHHGGPPPGQFQQPLYSQPPAGYPSQAPFLPQNAFPQGAPPPGQFQGSWQQQPPPPPGPPSGFYGQGAQGFGFPGMPSPGYDLNAPFPPGDASRDAEALYSAMKGIGTNEKQLIRVLSKPDPNQMRLLVDTYNKRHQPHLESSIYRETSGHFRDGLMALVRGPLAQDVHLLRKAIDRPGTKESFLNDVLCCRSNADIHAIKNLYRRTYNSSLETDIGNDLSMKTKQLFDMILSANRVEESAPYDPIAIEHDVIDLQRAMSPNVGKDQLTVCSILTSRSDNQIRGITHKYQEKFRESLSTKIKAKFSGHMEDALLLILGRAMDPIMTTAEQLEATMKGIGTNDDLLVQRVIRCHWDRAMCDQVKRAYRHRYGKDLMARVKSETSGDYKNLMLSCLE